MSKSDTKTLSGAFDLLPKSYNLVRQNLGLFALVSSASILMAVLPAFNAKDVDTTNVSFANFFQSSLGVNVGVFAVIVVVSLVLQVMAIALELKAANSKKTNVGELWTAAQKYTFRILGLGIVVGLMVALGLLLFIVPGIIVIGRLMLAPYVMVHEDLSIRDSLRRSNELSKGNGMAIWGVIAVSIVVAIVPQILVSIVSPVAASIVSSLTAIAYSVAPALRYFELKKLAE